MEEVFAIAPGRLLAAATVVLLTTLEDAVWLVPMVVIRQHWTVAVLHAVTFVLTFTALSLSIGAATVILLESAAVNKLERQDTVLSAVGAGLCSIIVAILYYKEWKKQKQKQEQQNRTVTNEDTLLVQLGAQETEPDQLYYGALVEGETKSDNIVDVNGDEADHVEDSEPQILLVVSLTIIGAIDEIAYFPGLIMGT